MQSENSHDPVLWSTLAIALLVAVTAVAGLFWSATYAEKQLIRVLEATPATSSICVFWRRSC